MDVHTYSDPETVFTEYVQICVQVDSGTATHMNTMRTLTKDNVSIVFKPTFDAVMPKSCH